MGFPVLHRNHVTFQLLGLEIAVTDEHRHVFLLQGGDLGKGGAHGLAAVGRVGVASDDLNPLLTKVEDHVGGFLSPLFQGLLDNHILLHGDAVVGYVFLYSAVKRGGLGCEVGTYTLSVEISPGLRGEPPLGALTETSVIDRDKPLGGKRKERLCGLVRIDIVAEILVCLDVRGHTDRAERAGGLVGLTGVNAKIFLGVLGVRACIEIFTDGLHLDRDGGLRKGVGNGSYGILGRDSSLRQQSGGQTEKRYCAVILHIHKIFVISIFCASRGSSPGVFPDRPEAGCNIPALSSEGSSSRRRGRFP